MSNKLSFSVFNWFWLVETFLYHWRDRYLLVFPPQYWWPFLTLGLRELLWQPWKLSHNPFPCTFSNLNLIRDNLVHLRYALFQPPEISPKAKFSIYPKSNHLDGDNFYWKSWSVTMNTSTWWFWYFVKIVTKSKYNTIRNLKCSLQNQSTWTDEFTKVCPK